MSRLILPRRRFLLGAAAVIAAPSIARALPSGRAGLLNFTGAAARANDATAQAWFNACASAGSAVSGADQTAWNNFIAGLRTDGLLSTFDFIAPIGAATATQSLIDMIGLRTMVAHGAPTFVAYQGYTGGNPAYIDTTFNPTTGGSQWTVNSAHMAIYTRTNVTTSSSMGVAASGGVSYIDPTDGGAFFNLDDASMSTTQPNGIGFWEVSLTATNRFDAYHNGASFLFATGPFSTNLPNANVFLLRDGGSDYSTAQHSLAMGGSAHTSAQAALLNSRVQTLKTALGW